MKKSSKILLEGTYKEFGAFPSGNNPEGFICIDTDKSKNGSLVVLKKDRHNNVKVLTEVKPTPKETEKTYKLTEEQLALLEAYAAGTLNLKYVNGKFQSTLKVVEPQVKEEFPAQEEEV